MFQSARVKLTAWYLLIIFCIIAVFSIVIYRFLAMEVEQFDRAQRFRIERRLGQQLPPTLQFTNPELVEEAKQHIFFTLLALDATLLAMSGILSYFLAGKTLAPIQTMIDEQHRFTSDASHELRTPLTSLKTTFEVYLRNKKPTIADAQTVMKESVEEVNKLQSLSESLLQLAHHQNPNGLPFEPLGLSAVVTAAIKKIQPLAKKKKQRIDVSTPHLTIEGNKEHLTDLLVALLDNAVKYSPPGKTIRVEAAQTDGSVQIRVIDHGVGIAKEDIPHIFNRFYRADSARTKTTATGYGLGLAIVKSLVTAHHGTISVKSILNIGTTFVVKLPTKQTKPHKNTSFFSSLSEKLTTVL